MSKVTGKFYKKKTKIIKIQRSKFTMWQFPKKRWLDLIEKLRKTRKTKKKATKIYYTIKDSSKGLEHNSILD